MRINYNIPFFIMLSSVIYLSGCQLLSDTTDTSEKNVEEGISILDIPLPEISSDIKEFDIVATESEWDFGGDTVADVWTYNGTVPGEEIRVEEGDFVRVNLKNELTDPVTIHFHGIVATNRMDGVAGVTQDAVQPGDSFTYEFLADNPGTYWYHSHQNSAEQVDKGLYGAFIVEPSNKVYDSEFTFILDEWNMGGNSSGGMMGGMMNGISGGDMDTDMLYDTYTVNGKIGQYIKPIEVNEGEVVRLRFVNAGYRKHVLKFNGEPYRVVEIDGNSIYNTEYGSGSLEIAPSERIDIELTINNTEEWQIESTDNNIAEDMVVNILPQKTDNPEETAEPIEEESENGLVYMDAIFEEIPSPDIEYDMLLGANMGMSMGMGMNNMTFTINEEVFPDTEPIEVKENDIVKATLINESQFDHPMHLHGHIFQIITINGEKLAYPVVKDMINVKPGESIEIMFQADNPGMWVFHCHDLNHAAGGMMTLLEYRGYYSPFDIHEHGNQPE